MKGKAAVGDIQDEAAVFRTHADVGDLHEFRSRSLTSVRRCHHGFAHLHGQLYSGLGTRIAFYFFEAVRMHPLPESNLTRTAMSTIVRKTGHVKGEYIRFARKVYWGNSVDEAETPPLGQPR
jgi:hypothetical protein